MSDRVSLFQLSTQYRHWRFSPESLAKIRTEANVSAVAAIRAVLDAQQPGSSQQVSFLSADEERLLVKLYIGKLSQLCSHFRFSEEVEATASTYLKRFYLKNTVMDWHPKNVMLTCLFLATKTTNNPIPLDAYTHHIPKTSPADVLALEFLVAQSLGFEFAVHHVHRALWGLRLDLQTLPDLQPAQLHASCDEALTRVRASRLSDAELIYTPAQIALACLHASAPTLAAQWARAKGEERALDTLPAIVELIDREGVTPEVEAVRDVDRRLRTCKNPEKVPGTQAYEAKRLEEEKQAQEKRDRKAAEARQAMQNGDPFGDDLPLDDDD